MKIFCHYLNQSLHKELFLDVDMYVSKKKRHVHLAFKIPISDCESFDKIITSISDHWEKRKVFVFVFFSDYRIIYIRLNGDLTMLFSFFC